MTGLGLLYLKAFLIALVEGLTEFVPVSSTGHMLLLSFLTDFENESANTYIVFIQLGAIVAVVGIYFRRYVAVFRKIIAAKNAREIFFSESFPSITHFFLGVFPVCLVGLLLYGFVKSLLFGVYPVIFGLFLGGIVMIWADRRCGVFEATDVEQLSLKQAFWIGLAQIFSLCPGVSRSGSTIVAGLLMKVNHQAAADYSFMIAAPVMVLAVGYDLYQSWGLINLDSLNLLAFGFGVALLVAYLTVRWFLKLLPKWKLTPFGIYRILLAAFFGVYLFFKG